MMVTVKYIAIVLNADNESEGGTFSCYSLLSRYSRIVHRDPREEQLVSLHFPALGSSLSSGKLL